jgi:hypothetical protein
MKIILSAFPFLTITAAQHLGAAVPTLPACIIAGISAFIASYFLLRILFNLFFPKSR